MRRPGPRRLLGLFDAAFMLPLGVSAVTVGFGFLIALDTPLTPIDAADATFATDNFKAGELIGQYAKAAAAEIGYPLMLKATAGGGGRGIRMVASDADLEDAYLRTRDEAERAFGSGVVFLERLVTGARHVRPGR